MGISFPKVEICIHIDDFEAWFDVIWICEQIPFSCISIWILLPFFTRFSTLWLKISGRTWHVRDICVETEEVDVRRV